ncbi:MAG: isochorismatase family protein [Burkholderiaceae bacterium]|nr:MAG: isochorismatase family protein [Burkholderiaceae bacterium]TAM07659.1 MAG: isochorismatase family protein [Pusillimonas sp.]
MGDNDIYAKQGFGNSSGFGQHPALIIVDFVNGFDDPDMFGGGNIHSAILHTRTLLAAARRHHIAICFTRVVYADDQSDAGVFCLKAPSLRTLTESARASQIVSELEPREGELVLRKTQPSAFHETGLTSWLTHKGIDTVVIAGCTTSGCVRATAIDSMSRNFLTVVVTDCVGDRALAPHEANLFDIQQKYADLLDSEKTIAHFSGKRDHA